MALAGPADVDAVSARVSSQGYDVSTSYEPSSSCYRVQPAYMYATNQGSDAAAGLSPYVPINAHTQHLTPARMLQILDSMSSRLTAAASIAAQAAPAAAVQHTQQPEQQPSTCAGQVGREATAGSQGAGRQQAAATTDEQPAAAAAAPAPAALAADVAEGTAATAAGQRLVNFALVDGRDVVIMAAFNGLQPPPADH